MTATLPGAKVTGHRRLLEQLRADGVRHLFGNPGSSEEGLLDEITRFPDIEYVMGLQEAALVCMADGFAQATGEPSVVLLHSGVGLGNAVGSLYHALQRQTPMVVMAGEAGVAYDALEAHMSADLVDIARPVTKYATRAIHPTSLVRLLRRCIKVAATPPCGPVFLAVPQDVLDQWNDEPVLPTVVPDTRVVPDPGAVEAAAKLLAAARNPVILAGDGVAASGAVDELVRFAETWGSGVWGAMASQLVMPWTHPLYAGLTGHMFGTDSAAIVAEADAVVVCGTYLFPDVFGAIGNPFRADATVVHIDLDPSAIAKNHPVTIGMVSDPRLTLRALTDSLEGCMNNSQRGDAVKRAQQRGSDSARARAGARKADEARREETPMRMSAVAAHLADLLPPDAIIFDEALTNSPELTRWVTPERPGQFFQTPGGTLGVGLPGAVGVKLARPDRTVVGFTGDGGAMYTYQALWSAAHHRIAAKFVVCHNSSYRLLKENLVRYWHDGDAGEREFPPFFDVHEPTIDFVALAGALGVPGMQVNKPGEVDQAIRAMLGHDGPYLLEVVLDREVSG
jgi:benzoylformate decarboxylase